MSVYRALCGVWRRMAGKLSDRAAPPSAPPTGDRARRRSARGRNSLGNEDREWEWSLEVIINWRNYAQAGLQRVINIISGNDPLHYHPSPGVMD